MNCAPGEGSDQPEEAINKAHSEDWSDLADAQADLSLRWVHIVIMLVLSWCGSVRLWSEITFKSIVASTVEVPDCVPNGDVR